MTISNARACRISVPERPGRCQPPRSWRERSVFASSLECPLVQETRCRNPRIPPEKEKGTANWQSLPVSHADTGYAAPQVNHINLTLSAPKYNPVGLER